MISCAVSRLVIVCFGTLYPAYASYKAVKTKNVKEYVKWMMYWIVFALFTCAETFTDVFLAFWFPFYYEIKIILVLWLLSPATKGSSFLYRKFVHPQLVKREKDIDEYLARAKEQGYHAVLQLGTKGINYASQVLVQTALKGGGHIVNHLHRSQSLAELRTQPDECDYSSNMMDRNVIEGTVNHRVDEQSFSYKSVEPNCGYDSTEMIEVDFAGDNASPAKVLPSGTRLRPKRTKSTNLAEIGSSATLPRASKRTSGRRRITAPVV